MNDSKWIKDIANYVEGVPYGTIQINIVRVNRHTNETVTEGNETLRYTDNNECAKDILRFITSLIDEKHTGEVAFSITMKDGNINLLTIKNTKRTQY